METTDIIEVSEVTDVVKNSMNKTSFIKGAAIVAVVAGVGVASCWLKNKVAEGMADAIVDPNFTTK